MNNRIILALLISLAGCASPPLNSASPVSANSVAPPSVAGILLEIQRDGAGKAIGKFWNDNTTWETAMSAIRTGSVDGLSIYRALRPKSDAGMTEDLEAAIAEAVTPNPEGALLAFQDVSQPDFLNCGRNSQSALEGKPTPEQSKVALTELEARTKSLASLTRDSKVRVEIKSACWRSLKKAQAFWKKNLAR
jgi:hypothetical protein